MSRFTSFLPDRFTLFLVITVLIASVVPAHGQGLVAFEWVTNLAIALLFFLHGARLSREAIVAGIMHWRLHATVFTATFIMFPVIGLALQPLLQPLVTPELYTGILFLCCLPATVQSAIAFTSIARGNVPAAVCSASASSLLGIFLTPILVGIVIVTSADAPFAYDAVWKIMLQLLLPFILGQIARRWVGAWVHKRKSVLKFVDQGSILLVVFTAFSDAMNEGLWQQTPIPALFGLVVACSVLLALSLLGCVLLGKIFKFNIEDRITLLFGGSKKSLATGVPMAQIIFAGQSVGAIVLPLMLFHQIQLMVCAVLAARYAKRPD